MRSWALMRSFCTIAIWQGLENLGGKFMFKKILLAFMLIPVVSYANNYQWQDASSNKTAWGYYSFYDQYNAMARPPLKSLVKGDYNNYNQPFYGANASSYNQSHNYSANSMICNPSTVDYSKCLETDPDGGQLEWRFIRNLGWRKFTKYGAARKDWWDYKKTLGWPFHPTYGLLPR
jgi:hypothetical protein